MGTNPNTKPTDFSAAQQNIAKTLGIKTVNSQKDLRQVQDYNANQTRTDYSGSMKPVSFTKDDSNIGKLLGIKNLDSVNDLRRINDARRAAEAIGIQNIDSQNDVKQINSWLSANPTAPKVPAPGSGTSTQPTPMQVNEPTLQDLLIGQQTQFETQIAGLQQGYDDQIDFLQNSIGKGSWMHTFAGVGFPQTSEFWTKDNVTNFADITRISVNDKGLAAQGTNDPGTLSDTRVGDYLIIQERGSNDFGMYVVDDVAFEVIEGQTIREFGLKLYEGRGNGQTIVNSSRCQITTSRPMYVVVQDTEPKVSTRGVLWYREGDDILSISNYATGQVGVNGPQWTAINGGGPDANPDDYLKLSGGTMKGELAMGGHKVTGIGDPAADAQAANKRYVDTRLKRTGGTEQKMQGILYLGGHKIAGVGDPELSTDAANRKYVDNQIAAIPEPEVGGGSFIDDYDGNRFCRAGNLQTNLNSGDVLFMDADYNSTEKPDEIAYISLPKDEFDWHAFTNSGNTDTST